MLRKSLTFLLLAAVLAAGIVVYRRVADGKTEIAFTDPSRREEAQPIRFSTRQGALSLDDLKGKALLIEVWASWCPPCVGSVPHLIALQERFRDDLTVIGLNVDSGGWSAAEAFRSRHPEINYRIARLDPEPSLNLHTIVDVEPLGKVSALPSAFLLDRQGRLVGKYVGAGKHRLIGSDVEKVLSESP